MTRGSTVQGQIPWGYALTTDAPALDSECRPLGPPDRGLGPDKCGAWPWSRTLRSYSGSKRQDKSLKISGKDRDKMIRWPVSFVLALTLFYTREHSPVGVS